MPKNKNKKSAKKTNHNSIAFSVMLSLLLILVSVLIVVIFKQGDVLSKYELIEEIDNQACRYLDNQPSVNGSFDLKAKAPSSEPKLKYTCTTGEVVASKEIQGKFIDGYSLGATVLYLSSNEAAETYAKEKLNPLRFWSDDGSNKIQDKNYTFVVTDEKEPYFDAYRVRANAVLRVSLPCGDVKNVGEECQAKAEAMLDRELKGINVL